MLSMTRATRLFIYKYRCSDGHLSKHLYNVLSRDEFRRHKKADTAQTAIFMEAWAKYAIQLTNQLGKRGVHTAKTIGEFTHT